MNILSAKALIPADWPHSIKKADDRKRICEDVIQEIINQIQNENRNPTKWELDGFTHAIKDIRFGAYALAMNNAMSTFANQQDVSKEGDLWSPVPDNLALDKVERDLARLRGEPPRVQN
jgi:hypothetical protein